MSINDKELYQQKFQAQLDGWKADIDKLKARSRVAKADAQIELSRMVDDLDHQIKAAGVKLTELSHAGDGAWDSVKKSAEVSWDSLKTSVHDAMTKLKD